MKYGLDVSTAASYSSPRMLADLASEAEEAGWDGFFVWDAIFARPPDLPMAETVPYTAFAQDNANPGAGADFFSLEVVYTDTPELDQFDLFPSPAVFAGVLETGNVTVK